MQLDGAHSVFVLGCMIDKFANGAILVYFKSKLFFFRYGMNLHKSVASVLLLFCIGGSVGVAQASIDSTSLNNGQVATYKQGRIIGYLPGWKSPPEASGLATAGYTHIIVAFGVFSTISNGKIVPAFDTVTAAYIRSLQTLGIKVLLSLGGASTNINGTTVNFHQVLSKAPSQDVFTQEFIESVGQLISQYGFDGIDFDIESGLTASGTFIAPTGDIAVLANIIQDLHAKYPTLLLTLAPQVANISATSGFDATWGNYAALVMQTATSLEWVGIQLYNSGCAFGINLVCYDPNHAASPDASVAMATDLLANWPTEDSLGRATGFQSYASYLTPEQIVLGYPAANAMGESDGSPPAVINTIKRAIQCLRTATPGEHSCDTYIPPTVYPDIGGVFAWEVTYDQNNGYLFAHELKKCVQDFLCK